jgi:endo-1,4-beta-xylanase
VPRHRTALRALALASLLAIAAACGFGPAGVSHTDPPRPVRSDPTGPTLRQVAARDRLLIGTAVNVDSLDTEPAYRSATGSEFSSVTPESVMKWADVEPIQGHLDFSRADDLVRFARVHGQRVRGHTLVWTDELPAWLTEGQFTPAELGELLHKHITDEVSHFRGEVAQWDVVNEAVNDDGTLRDTIWLRALGPGYIADAFEWAYDADPNALLFYNDFGIEGLGRKSDAVRSVLGQLRARGVPIDGVGIQSHLSVSEPVPTGIQENLRRFNDMGLDTEITEADVRIPLPPDASKLAAQARIYGLLADACLGAPRCTGMTVWGFSDRHSWIPGTYPGFGAADLLDEAYRPKPAYEALLTELAAAGPPAPGSRS